MKQNWLVFLALTFSTIAFAQKAEDTTHYNVLPDITVVGRNQKKDAIVLPDIVGTNIYAGKKNTLILMENVAANLATNNMRQVMAKVPGIHIWESDPSGIQVGVSTRGLSPNRSWEFNIRQNGYDVAADPLGYPEAYYNPQLQAVQRLEVVRGQGALQYGPQFGGLMNYVLRNGSDIEKPLQVQADVTVGSNNLLNVYAAAGGKSNKLNYYAFFDHRNGNGWRQNSQFYTNAGFATVTLKASEKWSIAAELMHANMRSQQPGGLTDQQLQSNAQQSFRSRNWFDILWTTPALHIQFNPHKNLLWQTKLFAVLGDRNSVGFLQSITTKDSILANTFNFANRILSVDLYRNYGLESRVLTHYQLGKMQHSFSGGIRLYTGTTHRRSDGKGTNGSNYDMTEVGVYQRDIEFDSKNIAAFAENIFRVGKNLKLIPGLRYEWIQGSANGRNGFAANGQPILLQNITRSRSLLLLGFGAEYALGKSVALYGNWTQAYRPIQFANLQAAPTTDIVDENLADSKGYNLDLGGRGTIGNFLTFDASLFWVRYGNRVGVVTQSNGNRLITNVGASNSAGIETFAELDLLRAAKLSVSKFDLSFFVSYSYTDARYDADHKDAGTRNKWVENAPRNILRAGLAIGYKKIKLNLQYNYVDEAFSDANNTLVPTANAQSGLIPSYSITDLHFAYRVADNWQIKSGITNLFEARYFTRRAGGYPGPGAMPGDGRSIFLTLSGKL
jgi:Fe(3+) dicitrate transport protein